MHAGCSKAEPKNFRHAAEPLPAGMGQPKFNQLEMVATFCEDRCTQFRVTMVTHTHRQDQLQYTAPQLC